MNRIAPSTAIATPGAAHYIPSDHPTEDVAYLAECSLRQSHLPAAVPSPASHPAILASGE